MSTRDVRRCYLVCDSCGAEHQALVADATMARIGAASEGWKFVKYDRCAHGERKASPRTWDACRDCELPGTPEEALKIRKSAEVAET